MRKGIVVITAMVMIFLSTTLCYGAVKEESTVSPLYESVAYYSQSFTIDDEGIASYSLTVRPVNIDPPDKVTATVTIVGPDGGNVYKKTKTLSYSSVQKLFSCADSTNLNERGEYEMKVTFKCYKGSTLIETITATPKTASY